MLNLKDGTLWQWDIGRKMIIILKEGSTIDKVQFYNGIGDNAYPATSIEVVDGEILAGIPNSLLCYANNLTVYLMTTDEDGIKTQEQITLVVNKRAKPEDYIFTDDEFHTYKVYDERLKYLEKNIVVPERLEKVVDEEIGEVVPDWAMDSSPDVSLSQGGKAAEAAKVGNEINSLKAKDNSLVKEIEVERARINNLVANTGEQTEGNEELIDARVGSNGITYDTTGEAIREQFSDLKNESGIDYVEQELVVTIGTCYDVTTGIVKADAHCFSSDKMDVYPGQRVLVTLYSGQYLASIAMFDKSGTYIGRIYDKGVDYYYWEDKEVTIPKDVHYISLSAFNKAGYETKLLLEKNFRNVIEEAVGIVLPPIKENAKDISALRDYVSMPINLNPTIEYFDVNKTSTFTELEPGYVHIEYDKPSEDTDVVGLEFTIDETIIDENSDKKNPF